MASFSLKRRNMDVTKPRRPCKRSGKFSDVTYGSSLVYLKIFLIWCSILLADFILEFRFEYLWPFWLMLQNLCDSFKYQGMILSVTFVCCTLVSGAICFFLVPVQLLFFIASTYVWARYIWHADRGICLPTIALWLLLMYTEASMRLKGLPKSQFQVNLCRPFAAHCVGYPFITFGFGVGSYVQYRLRIWTQDSVRMENEFYFELLRNALPQQSPPIQDFMAQDILTASMSSKCNVVVGDQSGTSHCRKKMFQQHDLSASPAISTASNDSLPMYSKSELRRRNIPSMFPSFPSVSSKYSWGKTQLPTVLADVENSDHQSSKASSSRSSSVSSVGSITPKSDGEPREITPIATVPTYDKKIHHSRVNTEVDRDNKFSKEGNTNSNEDIRIEKLESCISELRLELNMKRQCEGDKSTKNELAQLRRDNDQLQTKLHNLVSIKQKDKQVMKSLEKRLKAETVARAAVERILHEERKKRQNEGQNVTERMAASVSSNSKEEESQEHVKNLKDVEMECEDLKKQLIGKNEVCMTLEKEINELKQKEKVTRESETLMSALAAMQEKNMMLEKSLSAETRLKLDLFSALGDAKRQLEISLSVRCQLELETQELKARIAEVLSVMPDSQISPTRGHYLANFLENRRQPSLQLNHARHYSATIRSFPISPLPQQTMDPSVVHTSTVVRPSGVIGQMSLDPSAASYAPSSTAL